MTRIFIYATLLVALLAVPAMAGKKVTDKVGKIKPVDSELKVAVGDMAPDFVLRSIKGHTVRLSDYRGKKNVVISFVPAAWTPICSDQWPGYNLALELFEATNTQLIGITVDNTPTQGAWAKAMGGLDFPVLSDFWPHGKVADMFGVLRSNGIAERALFVIDTRGIIRYIDVHDISSRPDLGVLIGELQKLSK